VLRIFVKFVILHVVLFAKSQRCTKKDVQKKMYKELTQCLVLMKAMVTFVAVRSFIYSKSAAISIKSLYLYKIQDRTHNSEHFLEFMDKLVNYLEMEGKISVHYIQQCFTMFKTELLSSFFAFVKIFNLNFGLR